MLLKKKFLMKSMLLEHERTLFLPNDFVYNPQVIKLKPRPNLLKAQE